MARRVYRMVEVEEGVSSVRRCGVDKVGKMSRRMERLRLSSNIIITSDDL